MGCSNLNAQTKSGKILSENYQELKIHSLQKSNFADTEVKYIDIVFFAQKPSYVKVYLNDSILFSDFKEDSKYFDLNFDGDAYVWKQNYPDIFLPKPFDLTGQNLYGQKNNDFYDIRRISLYPDSTLYYFSININFDRDKSIWGFPAKYNGNIKSIQNEISELLAQNKSVNLSDSIVVFELTITKQGNIKSVALVGGKESLFSKCVHEIITKYNNVSFADGKSKWNPAIIYSSGRPIETKVKLYAKLDKNNSVIIKLPNTLRNFTGN